MSKITLEILIVSNCDTVEFNTSGLKLVSKNKLKVKELMYKIKEKNLPKLFEQLESIDNITVVQKQWN